jgi:hypothetical protein
MLIDCDVHLAPVQDSDVTKFLPARWQEHNAIFQRRFSPAFYPRRSEYGERFDSWPPSGLRPGSDFEFVREQHLDAWGVDYAVITPVTHPGSIRNLELSAAVARAMNEWQVEHWLSRDDRVRGSILVPTEHPAAAVEEIERWAPDGRFVQIYLYSSTAEPIGRRRYWPMLEAAERCGMAVGMHFGSGSGNAPTGAGFPSYYLEEHAGVTTAFQDQVSSLVFEGVFQHLPELRFVLIEGGFGWLAPLMWRLDAAWRRLSREVPHVDRLPSETIRDRVWYTTQPMEEPPSDREFEELLVNLGGPSRMMFASDYPHWDFDAPDRALPPRLDTAARRRILGENAAELYGLPVRSPAAAG